MNEVRLYGICTDKESPWVVMELMRGGDLLTALTDPFRLVKNLERFSKQFDVKYSDNVLGKASLSMKEALQKEVSSLQQSVHSLSSFLSSLEGEKQNHRKSSIISSSLPSSEPSSSSSNSSASMSVLADKFEELLECGESHWSKQTSKSYKAYSKVMDDVSVWDYLHLNFLTLLSDSSDELTGSNSSSSSHSTALSPGCMWNLIF